MKTFAEVEAEQRRKLAIVGQAKTPKQRARHAQLLFLLPNVLQRLRVEVVDQPDVPYGERHLLHQFLREQVVAQLARKHAQQAVATAQVMIEEAKGRALRSGCHPERELGELDGQGVDVYAINATFSDARADEFNRSIQRKSEVMLVALFGALAAPRYAGL